MSRISFDDTPESDSVAEHVMLEDIVKLEGRISQLEGNINMFIRYVASIRFTTAERDSAPWMSNWEANLLSGTLVAPIPYVEPEPEYEVEAEIDGKIIVIDDLDELVADNVVPLAELVDTGTGTDLAVPADVADEDAASDETVDGETVDDSEPPLSAA